MTSDVDGSLVEIHSENKQQAASHYTGGYGFHPMFCFTAEGKALDEMLRPGNAAANVGADQFVVVNLAMARLPECGCGSATTGEPLTAYRRLRLAAALRRRRLHQFDSFSVRQKQYLSGTICVVPGKYWDALMDVAIDNGGYVTPALVAPLGVPAVELRKMVSRRTLTPAGHGVYRIPSLPLDRFDEFILARLWAVGRGVISHDSALVVHELCDINPTHVHLTIPTAYRISRSGGEHYKLHRADLTPAEITHIDAVTLTTIRRTLDDVIDTVQAYLVRQAITTALERGAIKSAERDRLLSQLDHELMS